MSFGKKKKKDIWKEEWENYITQKTLTLNLSLSCIRKWRSQNDNMEKARKCPLCIATTHYIVPSNIFISDPNTKALLVEAYKEKMSRVSYTKNCYINTDLGGISWSNLSHFSLNFNTPFNFQDWLQMVQFWWIIIIIHRLLFLLLLLLELSFWNVLLLPACIQRRPARKWILETETHQRRWWNSTDCRQDCLVWIYITK